MSNHFSAANLRFPGNDRRSDLTDVFAFASSQDPDNTVLIIDSNPTSAPLPANQQYTYDFDGVSEVLDHILITKGIGNFTYHVVHVNAEFANQVSDHDPQVVDIKP